jgi:hypothetical protein
LIAATALTCGVSFHFVPAGAHSVARPAGDLAGGVYLAGIVSGNQKAIHKITVVGSQSPDASTAKGPGDLPGPFFVLSAA